MPEAAWVTQVGVNVADEQGTGAATTQVGVNVAVQMWTFTGAAVTQVGVCVAVDIQRPYIGPVAEPCQPPAHGGQGRHGYSLTLKPSVISIVGSVSPMDITDLAQNWTRSIRLQGGFWTGSFSMPLNKRALDAFDTWLGCHVEERSGGLVSWEGLVYEMELSQGGVVQRRSLEDMYNANRVDYTNYLGTATSTAWLIASIPADRYGRKDMILTADTSLPDAATAIQFKWEAEHAFPWPKPTAFAPGNTLTVNVCGYCFTANWRYNQQVEIHTGVGGYCGDVPAGFYLLGFDFTPYAPIGGVAQASIWTTDAAPDAHWGYVGPTHDHGGVGTQDGVSIYQEQTLVNNAWNGAGAFNLNDSYMRQSLQRFSQDLITGGDIEHLNEGLINFMSAQVDRTAYDYTTSPTRPWEAIQDVLQQGDYAGNPWQCYVDVGRVLNLTQISTTPRYFYRDGSWLLHPDGSPANPWQLRPSVVRATNWRFGAPRFGFWLDDPRDILVEEFEVASDGSVRPMVSTVEQSENLLYSLSYLARITGPEGRVSPTPPNWNVEANRPNPLGPGGDTHGYWTVQNGEYVWVHDPSITVSSWWNPLTGQVEFA